MNCAWLISQIYNNKKETDNLKLTCLLYLINILNQKLDFES